MANAGEGIGLLKALRSMRDIWVDAAAKTTLQITSSTPYARITGALAQPGLLAAGVMRRARESSMGQLLGYFNMPSREEVLGISQRLTRIEMTLDDLGAALAERKGAPAADAAPRATPAPQPKPPAAELKARPQGEA